MAEGDSTAAAASGDNGATAQTINFGVTPIGAPSEWLENEIFKPFLKEENGVKRFDPIEIGKSYAEIKSQIPVVPAKADDYKAEFPENSPFDEVERKMQRELASTLKMTQEQYEGMVSHDHARFSRQFEEMVKTVEAVKSELVKEWGGHQKFESNMAMVRKAAGSFFGPEMAKLDLLRVGSLLGDSKGFVSGLYAIATKLTEDTLKSGDGSGAGSRPLGIDGRPILDYSKTTPGPGQRT